jgi:SAM-dependent methyltransferase
MPDRARVRELAAEYIRRGDPLGWFEALYQEAEAGDAVIPWADREPNPRLIEFWKAHPLEASGQRALVIGSGLGDDSEQLAAWGFQTVAFDISKTAIENTKRRHLNTHVEYVIADLFHPPAAWIGSFDFVLEVYTIQSFPAEWRWKAVAAIAQFVAPGGRLLVIARGRGQGEPEPMGPPWPLVREELDGFRQAGLEEESFEDYVEPEPPWVRRFRVLYQRPTLAP